MNRICISIIIFMYMSIPVLERLTKQQYLQNNNYNNYIKRDTQFSIYFFTRIIVYFAIDEFIGINNIADYIGFFDFVEYIGIFNFLEYIGLIEQV